MTRYTKTMAETLLEVKKKQEAIDATDTGGEEEVSMAVRQVSAMQHFLQGIESRVKETGDMEEWFQNKLTKANDYLKSLYGYGKGDDESVNEQIDEKMGDAFNRSMRATVRGGKTADYIQKKAKERSDLNKKNDPGMAKKGYALSVTDREKAMKKARKRGLNPKYPSQKFGKPNLPEGIEDRHADAYDRVKKHLDQVKSPEHKAKFQKKFDSHLKSFDHHYEKDTGQEHHAVDDMHDLANDIKKHNSSAIKKEQYVQEKTLTPAEKKKREEIAKAIERDNPKMPMDKKMAIATATAKKVAESSISDRTKRLIERAINRKT